MKTFFLIFISVLCFSAISIASTTKKKTPAPEPAPMPNHAQAPTPFFKKSKDDPKNLVNWEILRLIKITKEKELIKKIEVPKKVKKHIGKNITMKGFMLPLDYESKTIAEFLFVPYVPSCMHVPPPPANQVIYVKMKKGSKVKPSYYPIKVEGVIKVGKPGKSNNEFMESTLTMTGKKVVELK